MSREATVVIGLDAGGTKTHAVAFDGDLNALGETRCRLSPAGQMKWRSS